MSNIRYIEAPFFAEAIMLGGFDSAVALARCELVMHEVFLALPTARAERHHVGSSRIRCHGMKPGRLSLADDQSTVH